MWLLIIKIIAFALAAAIFYYSYIYAPGYKGAKSDHFNGKRFHNPQTTENKTFRDFIKWRRNRKLGPWRGYTDSPPGPPPPKRVGKGGLHVTFINHATTLIQVDNLNILTDPIWSERCSPFEWAGPRRVRPPGIRFEDLPPIDYILISHNHYDQLNIATLKRLHKKFEPLILAGLGNSRLLKKKGLTKAKDLDWWQSLKLSDDVRLTSVPAQHFSGRGFFDQNKTLWMGFVIQGIAGTVYFAGDTGYGPHFKQIRERFGPITFAILPIGAYQPRWFMSPVHISPQEAVQVHQELEAAISMGVHFGTFIIADDGQDEPVDELYKALKKAGVPRSQFWVLDFGEGRDVCPRY